MARGPATFKQQDVTRALKAARAAGVGISRIEIDKSGKIVLLTGSNPDPVQDGNSENPWDTVR